MVGCLFYSLLLNVEGTNLLESDFQFVPNVTRTVGIMKGGFTLIGNLDKNGVFVETSRNNWVHSSGPAYLLLNGGELNPQPVYEYRGGTLVPGTMRCGGDFVPAKDGETIHLDTYVYHPKAVRIWNLPGYFKLVVKPRK